MPFIVDVSRQTTVANTFAVFATTTAWAWRRMWGTKCTHEYITLPCAMPALPFCKVLLFVILIIVIIVDNYNNCVAFSLVFFAYCARSVCVCVCCTGFILCNHIFMSFSLSLILLSEVHLCTWRRLLVFSVLLFCFAYVHYGHFSVVLIDQC